MKSIPPAKDNLIASIRRSLPAPRNSVLNSSRPRHLLVIIALAALYFAAARLGLSLASVHTNVSPVWPPTGIAIAAVLLLGYRAWPGILLGAFLANFFTPIHVAVAAGIAVGNTLEAVSAGIVLRSLRFRSSFERARDVFNFVFAALFCTMLSATIGNLSLCLGHAANWAGFGQLWLTWWLGDLVGAVVVAPLLLTWGTEARKWLPNRRYLEAVILLLLISLAAIVTFGKASPLSPLYYPLSRMIVPLFLWAAFRLGQRGMTLATVVLSVFAVMGTAHGLGPFISSTSNESLLILQVFVGSNAVMFLFLVAVLEERRLSGRALRENERRVAAHLAITRILAESPALSDAMPQILQTIGETLNWEVGAMWTPDWETNVLCCLTVWHAPSTRIDRFESWCRERTFTPGAGLPGRVWTNLKPAWIPDVTSDENFPRASVATAEGLHGAFGFPIKFSDKFLGVMEFFSYEIRQPDGPLLAMFASIGSQIGQFIERKRAEETIESASLLPKENPFPVIRLNRGEILTYANPAAQAILTDWNVKLGEQIPAEIAQLSRDVLSKGSKRDLEMCFGSQTYVVSFAPVVHANYVNLYFNDITDRKRAEEAALKNQEALKLAHKIARGGTWQRDLITNQVEWSQEYYELLGLRPDEVPASFEEWSRRVHPDDLAAVLKEHENAIAEKRHLDVEFRIKRADGQWRWFHQTGRCVYDPEEKPLSVIGITFDITERRHAEEEREQLLAREHEARAEAEIANRIKDEFLATLSHELRTPLTAMLGWLSMLRGQRLDKKTAAHALETIERNARIQAQLIEDLVDVSRIVGGKLNLEVRPLDLLLVIEAAVEVVRPAADAKGVEIRITQESFVGPVPGDPARLQQVIWNLLSNAVKFTSRGGVVEIVSQRSGSSAEIVVRDTGVGIDPDFLPYVFERFRQAESSLTRSHRGLGLGLAIVRHLVELHGGTVRAESLGEGQGSTFTITLPLAAEQTTRAGELLLTRPQFADYKTEGQDGALKGLRVLIVEDERDARDLLSLILEQSGATVAAVESAQEALQRVDLFQPNVLLSDIGLPTESGYELIRKIRNLPAKAGRLPAVALTAFATEKDRELALSAGYQIHLAKPVDPNHVIQAIARLAGREHRKQW